MLVELSVLGIYVLLLGATAFLGWSLRVAARLHGDHADELPIGKRGPNPQE